MEKIRRKKKKVSKNIIPDYILKARTQTVLQETTLREDFILCKWIVNIAICFSTKKVKADILIHTKIVQLSFNNQKKSFVPHYSTIYPHSSKNFKYPFKILSQMSVDLDSFHLYSKVFLCPQHRVWYKTSLSSCL